MGSDPKVWKTAEAPTWTYLQSKALNKDAFAAALTQMGEEDSGDNPGNEGTGIADGGLGNVNMEQSWDNLGESLREEDNFKAFITSVNEQDFEAQAGWYRWSYMVEEIDYERMLDLLKKRYEANEKLSLTWDKEEYVSKKIKKLDTITAIYMEKRGSGGVADELVIETRSQKIKVISEHNIRYVLNNGVAKVERQNGSKVDSPSLLPSGFFIVETIQDGEEIKGYTLRGGGFGHGVGMSQNGAKEMAKSNYVAEEILLYFYENCEIKNIYGM